MKIVIAAAATLLATGCMSTPGTATAFGDNECAAPSSFKDYQLGADIAGNAAARRQANLQCGWSDSPKQEARDRELANIRNTPGEQTLTDQRLTR